MKCPRCQIEMKPRPIAEVELDECPRCRGIWLDRQELNKLRKEVEPDLQWLKADLWKVKGEFGVRVSSLRCPREHQVPMRTLHFADPDAEIRFCPVDRGVWVESGDYHKIIQMLAEEAEKRDVSDYISASLKEAADIVAHPDRFLSEWRDLRAVLRLLNYSFFAENPRIRQLWMDIQRSLPL